MNQFIRSFLCALFFGGFGLGGLFLGTFFFPLICFVCPKNKQKMVMVNSVHYAWCFFVKLAAFFRLFSVNSDDIKNLRNTRGSIIVANHPSLIDIVILISLFKNTTCIVKGSLAHNFFIKRIINKIYLINSEDVSQILRKAEVFLKQGYNIVIFPEGTRSNNNSSFSQLHRIFAHLSLRSNKQILVLKIQQSFPILCKNKKWYQIGDRMCEYTVFFRGYIKPSEYKSNNMRNDAKNMVARFKEILS